MIVYITGGARSGKSKFGLELAGEYENPAYLATAKATDEEMKLRISEHQKSRTGFTTYEDYKNIAEIISDTGHGVYLLDCITTLITNLMFDLKIDPENFNISDHKKTEDFICGNISNILASAKKYNKNLIVISNEIGLGLVPVYAFSRFFRDVAGRVNQLIAESAASVYITFSGLHLKIK